MAASSRTVKPNEFALITHNNQTDWEILFPKDESQDVSSLGQLMFAFFMRANSDTAFVDSMFEWLDQKIAEKEKETASVQ